ncbi:peptide-methionine (S)-S-oxide reductase [Nitrosopumilus zosterae]|uniref:Peptide methionine sulfoxide reductase MsrA n=1 Tax=Nitrosopumilus zosterae TaxID=718286 RepID=A0A2S2KT30_9ARCH|nr:peptide-methionine (S)-S-oxide reductase MsrA [Nitrosopumilus zosterae]BDQ30770.1 peptide-methionine (S)-S-oxide reductase MsrA [Nitrosopumilus zosterae]GBH34615.1 peptide-methionine (S)-S-oxide reductase [Nitrosopumilus zosterae]
MKATFGAGCFWHVEDLFNKTKGIKSTHVGYIGGQLPNPTYEEVCTDQTGHAEAVEVEFDPDEISYEELLDVFWNNHNPTTLNRQGPDVGHQYRSAIFVHNEEQKKIAEKSKQDLEKSGRFENPVVTEIVPAPTFYKAEEYHQKYFKKHGFS